MFGRLWILAQRPTTLTSIYHGLSQSFHTNYSRIILPFEATQSVLFTSLLNKQYMNKQTVHYQAILKNPINISYSLLRRHNAHLSGFTHENWKICIEKAFKILSLCKEQIHQISLWLTTESLLG